MRKLVITMVLALLTISETLKAKDEKLVLHHDLRTMESPRVQTA